MSYYGATICLNGHVISKRDANAQKYCTKCGKETYSTCTNCGSPIRGLVNVEGVLIIGNRPYDLPYYCYSCGSPYPWTQRILDHALELISLDDDLDDTSKELIKNAIPDLLVETPVTPVAAAKYRKGISKAGQIIQDSMYNLLVDIVSETVKKLLFQ